MIIVNLAAPLLLLMMTTIAKTMRMRMVMMMMMMIHTTAKKEVGQGTYSHSKIPFSRDFLGSSGKAKDFFVTACNRKFTVTTIDILTISNITVR